MFKTKVMTMNECGTREFAEKTRCAPALSAGGAGWVSVLILAAFIAAGLANQPAWAQSQSKEVREHVKHAAVEVFTCMSRKKKGDTPLGSGSGYFINRTGLCITNNHVVDPTHKKPRWEKQREQYLIYNRLVWYVIVDAGTEDEKRYEAYVQYQDDMADQAILQVYGEGGKENGQFLETPHYLKLVPNRRLSIGQKVWCYGFPGGDSRKLTKKKHPIVAISEGHIVSMPQRPDGDLKMINTDVMADPGNSGGPMVDINGYCVGTLTLKPVAEYAGRSHQSALVPPDLTRDFITFAFQRGKLESGIDLEPFYTHLVGRDGFVSVAGYVRQTSTDCLFLEDGNRICGAPVGDSVVLPTPLGELTLPCVHMAYLLEQDDEYGIILMDGGQRLPFLRDEAVIHFKPSGGEPFEQDLSEVCAVVFRKAKTCPEPPQGKNLLIGGDNYHLLLRETSGKFKFIGDLGVEISRSLNAISAIETNKDDEQVVHFLDGSKVIGEFEGHAIQAVLAISDSPQNLVLTNVRAAIIDEVDNDKCRKRETTFEDLFVKASLDLQALAKLLEEGKIAEAKQQLAKRMEHRSFVRQGWLRQDQLRLLDATCDWLEGDLEGAKRGFKKLKRSGDEGIKWYAQARVVVLDRFPDAKFDGKPLSDPQVYKHASAVVARDALLQAKQLLTERETEPPENRRLFMKLQKQINTVSDRLMIASQLGSNIADRAMLWLWSWQSELYYSEFMRLQEEIQNKQEEMQKLTGAAREYTGRRMRKDIKKLEKNMENTLEWYQDLSARLRELGFIIGDPDLDLLE
ncbi:MAG: trypsin-like peptidase domain-containing protein [Phycisphaerae bacterium]|nr:trypsin-like peptidase domain-containing protein [Phycisphaerae bacterium]